MAYSHPGLVRLSTAANSGAPVLWGYSTADTAADVNTQGYFNDESADLGVGDIIFANTSTGGTLVATIFYVLSNASGVVDVNDGTTLANTDTD